MTHDPANNYFGEFEDDFKSVKKADPMSSPGRIPPGVYKIVCSAVDLDGSGKAVDHDKFTANTGTKGFKLFFEVLEPEFMPNPATGEPVRVRGEIVEHVFWVTKKNLPYMKRDLSTILGQEIQSLNDIPQITWAGRTAEVGIHDEARDGFVHSRVRFINAWKPGAPAAAQAPAAAAAPAAPQAPAAPPAAAPLKTAPSRRRLNGNKPVPAPSAAPPENVDF